MSQVRLDASCVPTSVRRNQTPYWGEHTARYGFAVQYVSGLRVLDIACGTGYGLSILGESTSFLVGADLDFEAIKKARSEISNDTTAAMVADCCRLPFANETFEAVTSFETLEHLEFRSQFLSELRRVLTPSGVCIISTPNANYTQPVNGRPRNPFHVFEYSPEEFTSELEEHFGYIKLFGQNLNPRFVISPFWEDQEKLVVTPKNFLTLLVWRVLNKLPFKLRDELSNTLWGHTLYPDMQDYQFETTAVQSARVLLAVCSSSAEKGS